mgnify:CR=1 FL=1
MSSSIPLNGPGANGILYTKRARTSGGPLASTGDTEHHQDIKGTDIRVFNPVNVLKNEIIIKSSIIITITLSKTYATTCITSCKQV